MKKLLVVSSHPAYYKVPIFRRLHLSQDVDLTVVYCTKLGVGLSHDKQFGKRIEMGIPVFGGYNHQFLKNYSPSPANSFFGQINPLIIKEVVFGKYDAVMIQGWNSFTNWMAVLACILSSTPIFIRCESPLNQEKQKHGFKQHIKKILLKSLFRKISAFLYIGSQNKKFYEHYGVPGDKLFFTPYAVDNERFQKAARELKSKRREFRKELGIKPEDLIILFVGKLIEKKRPFNLLKAFSLLNTKYNVQNIVHLVLVGEGKLRPELEKYAKQKKLKNVHFVGFKNQMELPKYYTMADIFVLPSGVGETWGLVVNEAMCFGLPVIVSDLPGSGFDLVDPGNNGFVFPLGEIGKLVEKLKILAENGERRKKFGEKSLEIIKKHSYEEDVEGIVRALNKCCNK